MKSWMMLVSIILLGGIVWGLVMVVRGGCATYMGLILTWAGPFLLILWCGF